MVQPVLLRAFFLSTHIFSSDHPMSHTSLLHPSHPSTTNFFITLRLLKKGFKSEARGSGSNMQTSPVLDRLPDKEKRMLNQFNTSSQQRAENEINALRPSKKWYLHSFRPSELFTKQRGSHRNERKPSFRRRHKNVENCTQPACQASH